MELAINLKSSYGRTLAYPANTQAQTLAAWLQRTTLTRRDLTFALQMGYTIQVTTMGMHVKTLTKPSDLQGSPCLSGLQ